LGVRKGIRLQQSPEISLETCGRSPAKPVSQVNLGGWDNAKPDEPGKRLLKLICMYEYP